MITDDNIDQDQAEPVEPEESEQETAPASDDPLEGREDLQQALYQLYLKCVSEDRYPRLIEVKDVKQAEFFWGGRQYIWWSANDKQWNLPSQAKGVSVADMGVDDMPRIVSLRGGSPITRLLHNPSQLSKHTRTHCHLPTSPRLSTTFFIPALSCRRHSSTPTAI